MPKQEYPKIQRRFGAKVQQLRETFGLTREELAEKAEYSPQNLAKIEAGERFVTAEALERLSKALKARPEEFFEQVEKPTQGLPPSRQKLNRLLDKQDNRRLEMIFDVVTRILKEV